MSEQEIRLEVLRIAVKYENWSLGGALDAADRIMRFIRDEPRKLTVHESGDARTSAG